MKTIAIGVSPTDACSSCPRSAVCNGETCECEEDYESFLVPDVGEVHKDDCECGDGVFLEPSF